MFFVRSYDILLVVENILNVLSWSSGQDVALSRRNQGFDSPREYQEKLLLKVLTFRSSFFIIVILGESNPKEPERK